MNNLPSFLPEMLNLDGGWESVLEKLYTVFKKDFIDNNVFYNNSKIIYDKRKIEGDKEEGFWHLITKEDEKLGRIPDYDRAKRLPWDKPTIENHSDPVIKSWDYLEGSGKIRIYLWLENYDYVIILQKNAGRGKHLIVLITAFYVEEYKKKDLQKRYEKRIVS